jgi:hypothetical protein
MNLGYFKFGNRSAARSKRLKETVLASFHRPASEIQVRFSEFTLDDWECILFWLDISGLALYLLDQLTQLHLVSCLPPSILSRLEGDRADNRERSADLFLEASEISRAMAVQGVSFALLKGITLTPDSVADSALRWQIDLDFLVAATDVTAATEILNGFGYALHAASKDTLEFRAGQADKPDVRTIYRIRSQRAVEVHLLNTNQPGDHCHAAQLNRVDLRSFDGVRIPTLSSADILIQQAVHLLKHLCSEHTRTSWVLEFWRHVDKRRSDTVFWHEVEVIATGDPQAEVALGASVLLSTLAFGEFASESLNCFTDRLPGAVRMWIEAYGMRVLLAGSPGNKLYLILRRQLQQSDQSRIEARRLVFPVHMPPAITRGEPGESISTRLRRYRIEGNHLLVRMRFHILEGIRYAIESARWQRRASGSAR